MALNKVQRNMLFTLGYWLEQANRQLNDPLKLAISKKEFINVVQASQLVEKKERALYHNLTTLEKKKLLFYENKTLNLTERGRKTYNSIKGEVLPYVEISRIVNSKNPLNYASKAQTKF